jgi:hypothetical protein
MQQRQRGAQLFVAPAVSRQPEWQYFPRQHCSVICFIWQRWRWQLLWRAGICTQVCAASALTSHRYMLCR